MTSDSKDVDSRRKDGPSNGLENSKFKDVPREIIAHIFKFVPLFDIIQNVPAVCQTFFDVSKVEVEKEVVDICFAGEWSFGSTPYFYPSEVQVISRIVKVATVKKLGVYVVQYVDQNFIRHIVSMIGHLCKEVQFKFNVDEAWNCGRLSNNALTNNQCFVAILATLRTRDLMTTFKYIWDESLRPGLDSRSNWPVVACVRNLHIEFDSTIDFVFVQDVKQTFPNLESFSYKDDGEENPTMWRTVNFAVEDGMFASVRRLRVERFPEDIATQRLRNLEALEIVTTYTANDINFYTSAIDCLTNVGPQLRHLKVTLPAFLPFDFHGPNLTDFFEHLPGTIETLVLKFGVVQVEGVRNALEKIADRCPNLRVVCLLTFGRISIYECQDLFDMLPMLVELVVEEAATFDNRSVTHGVGQNGFVFNRNVETVRACESLFFPVPGVVNW